ncbi:killer cell lectin-like receptor subfamily I member 1 [Budorcas taxicolor]|uniref:killer cell lectin-like receptor subfamily I member 1 n=1 Tax=Budorcas taxicolor TaxID=37181 RepID=UPI002284D13D|nr:killer cell lectin-like receptor subfamily I member 1 [Budorcas taxicolor]
MFKNMQNKGIVNKQEVTHTELKFPRSQQKQRRPKTNERNVISSEQQARHKEPKSHRFFLFQYRKWFRKKRKVSHHRSTKWQLLAWSLGILCVVLMITLRVLLANLFSSTEDQNQKISTIPTLSSKTGECSCDHCSTHWIGFGSSYYHLSSKPKTWMASHAACEELDTHLPKIDIKGELEILSVLEVKGWIGLKFSETSESWLWEDGTTVTENLFEFLKMEKDGCAYIDGNFVYAANCSSRKSYMCEFSV